MAASAKVLPPPPAQRSITVSPGVAPVISAAICEPSSWTSTMPLMKAGSDWMAGLLAPAGTRMRTPEGDHGVAAGL